MSLDEHVQEMLVQQARLEEKFDALEKRLIARDATVDLRLTAIESSLTRQGERIGKLEGEHHRFNGSKSVILALLGGGGLLGALALKIFESLTSRGGI